MLKFEKLKMLLKLENYIRMFYCSNYPATLYFQVHFVRVSSSKETTIKDLLRSERLVERSLDKKPGIKRQESKKSVIKIMKKEMNTKK